MTDLPRSSLSTGDWTDANEHDPGITMLEVLVYTLVASIGVVALGKWRSRRKRHSSSSGSSTGLGRGVQAPQ